MPPEVYGKIANTFSVSSAPTITFSSSAMGSAQAFLSNASNVPNFKYFSMLGVGFNQRGNAFPQTNVLQSFQTTEALGGAPFLTAFYHTGSQLDIIKYGDSVPFTLFVDGQYIGYFAPPTQSGTAQAGGANTITLAAGASATTNFYIGYSVVINSGTGSGQVGLISSYNGSTKVATMAANWTTAPDATSVYVVVDDVHGYQVQGLDGSVKYVNLNWGSVATRKIEVIGADWYGVNIGPNDTIWPAPPTNATRMVVVADSFFENTGGPFAKHPEETSAIARDSGWQIWPDGEGSTGWCAIYSTSGAQRLNFMDRIAPPSESWQFKLLGATAGTFTISVTYGGSTQTTAGIAYNASDNAVQTAIQALSNLPANSVSVAGGGTGGTYGRGWIILLHGVPGATLTYNASGLTGGSPTLGAWPGVVAPRVPTDGNGNALPFILFVQGSGNDNAQGFSASQIQTNATYAAQYIAQRFPTALTIFTGVISTSTHGVNGVIDATDVGYNNAIKTAAGYLPKINGNLPFIDTYSAGVSGNAWIFGGGTLGSPTTNKNDILISLAQAGHPTGEGYSMYSTRMMQSIKQIFGAQ